MTMKNYCGNLLWQSGLTLLALNVRMRKNRVVEQNRCYHLVSRLAHRAFFLDDEEKDRAVALMRRVEAGVKASMSYCINRTVSISSDPVGS